MSKSIYLIAICKYYFLNTYRANYNFIVLLCFTMFLGNRLRVRVRCKSNDKKYKKKRKKKQNKNCGKNCARVLILRIPYFLLNFLTSVKTKITVKNTFNCEGLQELLCLLQKLRN